MRLSPHRLVHLPACILAVVSCLLATGFARANTLSVAVAANVRYAFAGLQTAVTQQSGHRLQPLHAASGKLVTQITLGAPFDRFLSADTAYPAALRQAGFAAGAPVVHARGALVLWSLKPLDLQHWQRTRAILARNGYLAP